MSIRKPFGGPRRERRHLGSHRGKEVVGHDVKNQLCDENINSRLLVMELYF